MGPVEADGPSLPNVLTMSRIAAIPVIAWLAAMGSPGAHVAACAVFGAAGLTDWLDGKLARAGWGSTRLGAMLDPIADKLLVSATLVALLGARSVPWWGAYPAGVIIMREIMVSGMREFLATDGIRMPSSMLAKWKTGVQMGALGTLLAGDPGARTLGMPWLPADDIGLAMLCVAAGMTVWSAWAYATAAISHATRRVPAAPAAMGGRAAEGGA